MKEEERYEEFNDMKLAKLYDICNGLDEDEAFWLDQIDNMKAKNVIDFGCGTGLLTLKIAEKGGNVIGIDPAQAMLDLAKEKEFSDTIEWKLGSTDQISDGIDLILMTSHVVQFFVNDNEWEGLLSKAYESLNKGGYILFDSKNPNLSPWNNWGKEKTFHNIETQEGIVEMWTELIELGEKTAVHKHNYRFLNTGEELNASTTLVYRKYQEISANLEKVGFTINKVFGDFYGNSYKKDESKEMIFVAQKL